jgi:hypothetical protein
MILSFMLLDFRSNCLSAYSGTSGISQYRHCIFYPLTQREIFLLGLKYQVEASQKHTNYKTNTRNPAKKLIDELRPHTKASRNQTVPLPLLFSSPTKNGNKCELITLHLLLRNVIDIILLFSRLSKK